MTEIEGIAVAVLFGYIVYCFVQRKRFSRLVSNPDVIRLISFFERRDWKRQKIQDSERKKQHALVAELIRYISLDDHDDSFSLQRKVKLTRIAEALKTTIDYDAEYEFPMPSAEELLSRHNLSLNAIQEPQEE